MLGMRGVRERWSVSLEELGKLIENGIELIVASRDYVKGDLKSATGKLREVLEIQEKVLERELELKQLEEKRIALEVKKLEEQLHIHSGAEDD